MASSGATNETYEDFSPEKPRWYLGLKTAEDGVSFGLTLVKRTSALTGFVVAGCRDRLGAVPSSSAVRTYVFERLALSSSACTLEH